MTDQQCPGCGVLPGVEHSTTCPNYLRMIRAQDSAPKISAFVVVTSDDKEQFVDFVTKKLSHGYIFHGQTTTTSVVYDDLQRNKRVVAVCYTQAFIKPLP